MRKTRREESSTALRLPWRTRRRLWIGTFPQVENWIFYLVGTLLLCLVLGIVMYRTGIRMNGKSKIESMAPPVLDQIIAAGIYLVISAVFRFSYLVNPFACYLAIVFWSGGQVDYSPRAENIFHLLSLAFLQAFILGAVSLGAYALAKYKQDHKNPVLKKDPGRKSKTAVGRRKGSPPHHLEYERGKQEKIRKMPRFSYDVGNRQYFMLDKTGLYV